MKNTEVFNKFVKFLENLLEPFLTSTKSEVKCLQIMAQMCQFRPQEDVETNLSCMDALPKRNKNLKKSL